MKNYLLPVVVLLFTTSLCKAQNPTLWGMTVNGGSGLGGTIFKTNSKGIVTTEYNFTSGVDTCGSSPQSSLFRASNGLLYGTTYQGGSHNDGIIFSYDISTGKESIVHSFSGNSDGENPFGSLIQVGDSLLYGMTSGGGTHGIGTIFSFNIYTNKEIVRFNFNGNSSGSNATGSLIQANDSILYGMTMSGGANTYYGTVFSYNISSGTETVLHNFGSGTDGKSPWGSLIQTNDTLLYGMTQSGGVYDSGMIFSYNISNGIYTDIHDFLGGSDGKSPNATLIQANNNLLYGMTIFGGTYNQGIIFSYNITTNSETVIHNFGNGTDGAQPEGSLFQASDTLLYGMTSAGGANSIGIIFTYNIAKGIYTDIHDFTGTYGSPLASLIEVDSNTTTGINEASIISNQLSIYPNPTSGQFTVKLNDNQNGHTLEIYNMIGYKVFTTELNSGKTQIDLSQCASGFYLYRVTDEQSNLIGIGKIVIE